VIHRPTSVQPATSCALGDATGAQQLGQGARGQVGVGRGALRFCCVVLLLAQGVQVLDQRAFVEPQLGQVLHGACGLQDRAVAGAAAQVARERCLRLFARNGLPFGLSGTARTNSSQSRVCKSRTASRGRRPWLPVRGAAHRLPARCLPRSTSAMPSIEWASRMQLLMALVCSLPSRASPTTTVQAPQSPSPQPSLVPVQCRSSRSRSSRVRVGERRAG